MKKKYLVLLFFLMIAAICCTRYPYTDFRGEMKKVIMAKEKKSPITNDPSFTDFNLWKVNYDYQNPESVTLERICPDDIKQVAERYDYTLISLWNTGCPYSDPICFKTMDLYMNSGFKQSSIAYLLISENNNGIKESLIRNHYKYPCYYLKDTCDILVYKSRNFINGIDKKQDLYKKFKDDISNIDFLVLDKNLNILYARSPFFFSSRGNTLITELDSVRKIIN